MKFIELLNDMKNKIFHHSANMKYEVSVFGTSPNILNIKG